MLQAFRQQHTNQAAHTSNSFAHTLFAKFCRLSSIGVDLGSLILVLGVCCTTLVIQAQFKSGAASLTHDASSTEGRFEALYRRPLPLCAPLPPPPLPWLAPPSPLPLQQHCPQCTQHRDGRIISLLFLIWGIQGYSGPGDRRMGGIGGFSISTHLVLRSHDAAFKQVPIH